MTTWPPSTHQDVQDVVSDLKAVNGLYITGGSYYYMTMSPMSTGTFTTTNTAMRLYPWALTNTITISAVGAEITTAGNAGALLRLGLYNNGSGFPGTLNTDFGTVAADAVALPEISTSLTLAPGIYWWAYVAQSAATTAPVVRANTASWDPGIPLPHTTNASNSTRSGYAHSGGVSGALPGSFVFSGGAASHARIFIKVT